MLYFRCISVAAKPVTLEREINIFPSVFVRYVTYQKMFQLDALCLSESSVLCYIAILQLDVVRKII